MKKGIFGGTFDPIHNGHLYIAQEALERLQLDRLIFMPSGVPPHKTDKNITDGNIRYELVKMAVKDEPRFEVSDFELKKEGLSFTYQTVEYFRSLEGNNTEWYFITGADCLVDLPKWRNVDRILDACTLVVFNRPGYNRKMLLEQKLILERKYSREIIFLDLGLLDISSSDIRRDIKQGKKAESFLPEEVYNEIIRLGLYK